MASGLPSVKRVLGDAVNTSTVLKGNLVIGSPIVFEKGGLYHGGKRCHDSVPMDLCFRKFWNELSFFNDSFMQCYMVIPLS